MTWLRPLIAVLAVLAVASGCSIELVVDGPAGPGTPCAAVYSAKRCDAMLTLAAEQLGVADEDVTSIEIAPVPTFPPDGVLRVRSGSGGLVVLVTVDGSVRAIPMCVGVALGPACKDDFVITIEGPIDGVGAGYRDMPCAGEPPDGCASPVPNREPAAIAAARPLRIERIVVAIPGVGRHEVRLGTATLPNGVLTAARAELGDPLPDGVRFSSAGLRLEIRSLVPGRPAFLNIYEHGWYPGTEEVEVLLIFEARQAEPGATIEIRNLVVR